jgi:hypothetical protein
LGAKRSGWTSSRKYCHAGWKYRLRRGMSHFVRHDNEMVSKP